MRAAHEPAYAWRALEVRARVEIAGYSFEKAEETLMELNAEMKPGDPFVEYVERTRAGLLVRQGRLEEAKPSLSRLMREALKSDSLHRYRTTSQFSACTIRYRAQREVGSWL